MICNKHSLRKWFLIAVSQSQILPRDFSVHSTLKKKRRREGLVELTLGALAFAAALVAMSIEVAAA